MTVAALTGISLLSGLLGSDKAADDQKKVEEQQEEANKIQSRKEEVQTRNARAAQAREAQLAAARVSAANAGGGEASATAGNIASIGTQEAVNQGSISTDLATASAFRETQQRIADIQSGTQKRNANISVFQTGLDFASPFLQKDQPIV